MFRFDRVIVTRSGHCSEAYHAAASFMAHQQCRFNFGTEEYKYPPQDRLFKSFNDYGKLCDAEKRIIPRRVLMQQLKDEPIVDGACFICCDNLGNCTLTPCRHDGICDKCALQLHDCPICRQMVTDVMAIELDDTELDVTELDSTDLDAIELDTTELDVIELVTSELAATEIVAPELVTVEMVPPEVVVIESTP